MHTLILNVRDFLYEIPENLTIKIKPQSVATDGTTLLLHSPMFFKDGDVATLPEAIYSVEMAGGNVKQLGWIELDRDGTLANLFNIAISPSDIPTSLPIEAVYGLRAELDLLNEKAENALSPQQLAKLNGIEEQATKNQTDSFLLNRANHTGTQPANSVDGLPLLSDRVDILGDLVSSKMDANDRLFSLVNLSNPLAPLTLGLSTTGDVIFQNPANQLASTAFPGFMSSSDKTKLNGIATGATANSTDAQLRDRSTHTGSQAISTITGLQTALDGKADIALANMGGFTYRGSTVPSSPTSGQTWLEITPNGMFQWSWITGVGWVSMQEYYGENAFAAGVGGGWERWLQMARRGSAYYLINAFVFFFTGAAHDASNRLSIVMNNFRPDGVVVPMHTAKVTSALANSTNTLQLLDSPVVLPTNDHGIFRFNATPTGSVNISFQLCVTYRVVR